MAKRKKYRRNKSSKTDQWIIAGIVVSGFVSLAAWARSKSIVVSSNP